MEKHKGVDVFRAIAILYILLYHFYVYCGYPYEKYIVVHRFICMGGEIGVTLFYILSGYGIFFSLAKSEEKEGRLSYCKFIKRRFLKIAPQYYVGIAALLLLTSNAEYFSNKGFFQIVAHVLFVHNWFPSTFDKLSGVWWTLGTIFQFYLISAFLYKGVKKSDYFYPIAIIFVVIIKMILFHYVIRYLPADRNWYFMYGRQIFSAADNFIVGMVLSKWMMKKERISNLKAIVLLVLSATALLFLASLVGEYSPYSDTFVGYCWHSMVALCLAGLIYSILNFPFRYSGKISGVILFIAKYEYGIYIWHHLVTMNLIKNSTWFAYLSASNFIVFAIVMSSICIGVGFFTTKCLSLPKVR